MPYEAIEEKEYNKQLKKLGKLSFGVIKNEEAEVDKFCNSDNCTIEYLDDDATRALPPTAPIVMVLPTVGGNGAGIL